MSDAIESRDPARGAAEPEPPADDSPTPPLVVFDGDDDLVCVDDTCLPPDVRR